MQVYPNGKSPLITVHTHPKSPVAEAFRTLRTNLGLLSVDEPLKVVMITSPTPEEGKSTVASNLAVAYAHAGKHVLMIDCDLRKPAIHRAFSVENRRGLTNVLVEDVDLQEVTQRTDVRRLDVLASGPIPPNPSELLASRRMKELLANVKKKYQMVLIDTPPVLAVTDASILATLVDGAILVVRAGFTRKDAANHAKRNLEMTGVRLLGCILNRVRAGRDDHYYYYYYHEDTPADRLVSTEPR